MATGFHKKWHGADGEHKDYHLWEKYCDYIFTDIISPNDDDYYHTRIPADLKTFIFKNIKEQSDYERFRKNISIWDQKNFMSLFMNHYLDFIEQKDRFYTEEERKQVCDSFIKTLHELLDFKKIAENQKQLGHFRDAIHPNERTFSHTTLSSTEKKSMESYREAFLSNSRLIEKQKLQKNASPIKVNCMGNIDPHDPFVHTHHSTTADLIPALQDTFQTKIAPPPLQETHTPQPAKQHFAKRHWKKILVGGLSGLAIAGAGIACVLTLGVAPLVIAGIATLFLLKTGLAASLFYGALTLLSMGIIGSGIGTGMVVSEITERVQTKKTIVASATLKHPSFKTITGAAPNTHARNQSAPAFFEKAQHHTPIESASRPRSSSTPPTPKIS